MEYHKYHVYNCEVAELGMYHYKDSQIHLIQSYSSVKLQWSYKEGYVYIPSGDIFRLAQWLYMVSEPIKRIPAPRTFLREIIRVGSVDLTVITA